MMLTASTFIHLLSFILAFTFTSALFPTNTQAWHWFFFFYLWLAAALFIHGLRVLKRFFRELPQTEAMRGYETIDHSVE